MANDPTEITQPMTMEDAAAVAAGTPGGCAAAAHPANPLPPFSARVEPWMVAACAAGLLVGSASGYWLATRSSPGAVVARSAR